ncbi:MAG: SusC/RagA family TonB-linked outer membrane protein [Prevotella sp.]|nr:SusC/RagA family TonB-linked outer membrane protein [Prevotella sp.]
MKQPLSFVPVTPVCTLLLGTGLLCSWPAEGKAALPSLPHVQQTPQKLTGHVVDAAGEPVIGATIKVKGKNIGAVTDLDGNFSVEAKAGDVLEVSYIGYDPQELSAANGMNIQLKESSESLNEVVVIGYGSMRKRDLTGAVAQVKPDNLANEAPNTVQDVLRGTTGLNVGFDGTAKGGGSLSVRGQRSVYTEGDHNAPLIVLDGMIFYGELSEINPNDIAQIDILKDASSAAVYGAKAANGVIIVTTKKGTSDKPTIGFSANVGFATVGESRHPFGPEGYLRYREDFYTTDTYGKNPSTGNYEAYQTKAKPGFYARPTTENLSRYNLSADQWRALSNQGTGVSDNEIWANRIGLNVSELTLKNYLEGRTFDWYDHSFHTGINQDYNISVSGMSKRTNYYFSIGYLSNEGVARGDEYSSVRSNLKLNTNITDWLSVGANVNFQNRTDGNIATDWREQILDNSPFSMPYDDQGELIAHPMGEQAYWKGYNFDFNRQYLDMERGYTIFNTIFDVKLKLPLGITYTFNAAPRFQFYHNRYFESSAHPDWQAEDHNRVTREQSYRFDWSLNNTVNWDYTFDRLHHVNVTLVQESERRQHWQDNIWARNIQPSEALGFHATANGDKQLSDFSSTDDKESAVGYLARAFYSYDDRYMGTFSFRRDGYSAFGTTNPYANFFSGALAWTFTNEKFFHWKPMSYGKLRFSYGQNGNRSLADSYIALANLAIGQYTQGYVNRTNGELKDIQYLFVNRLANPRLQWEKTTSWNIGLDFGFLDNRINGSIEAYVMPTTDMIMNQSLPDFTGFTSITTNLGRVENRGVELTLNTVNIRNKDFEWQTQFSLAYNSNKIKHLYGQYETTVDANGNVTTREMDDITNGWFIGHPISSIWDYKVTGIWQKEEADEAALYGQKPGDPKVENSYTADDRKNADGTTSPVYNDNDKQFLGQTAAPVRWSMRNTLTYRNWSFSFNLYSYMGHKSMSREYLNQDNNYSQITNCRNLYEKEYWTIDHATNDYARINAQGPTGIEAPGKAIIRTFVRLENISLAYNLPKSWLQRVGLQSAKVFATIRNVATWCAEWEYGDPETFDGLAPRTYTLGINVSL